MSFLVNPFEVSPGTVTDPYYSNTVLLLHMDGTNGSTTIVDNSLAAHTTLSVTSTLTTAAAKFGSASMQSSGGSGGYALYSDHVDWELGSGQFTIECWARRTATISAVRSLISHWGSSAGNFSWQLAFNGAALCFFYSTTGSNNPTVQGNYTPTLNVFDFFAVDRDASNNIRVYAGTPAGVSIIGGPTVVSGAFFDTTSGFMVGNDNTNNRGWPGQIDEVRITKGVARFAGTITAPTAAFPNS